MYNRKMIEKVIKTILNAEQAASNMRSNAQTAAHKIEKKTQAEIELLKSEHAKQLNEKIKALSEFKTLSDTDNTEIITDKAKTQKAVQYIITNLIRGSS